MKIEIDQLADHVIESVKLMVAPMVETKLGAALAKTVEPLAEQFAKLAESLKDFGEGQTELIKQNDDLRERLDQAFSRMDEFVEAEAQSRAALQEATDRLEKAEQGLVQVVEEQGKVEPVDYEKIQSFVLEHKPKDADPEETKQMVEDSLTERLALVDPVEPERVDYEKVKELIEENATEPLDQVQVKRWVDLAVAEHKEESINVAETIKQEVDTVYKETTSWLNKESVAEMVGTAVDKRVEDIEPPKPEPVDYEKVEQIVTDSVARIPEQKPEPVDYEKVQEMVTDSLEKLPEPKPEPVDYERIEGFVTTSVDRIPEKTPEPVDYEKVQQMVTESVGRIPEKEAESVDYERIESFITSSVDRIPEQTPAPVDYDKIQGFVASSVGELEPEKVDYEKVNQFVKSAVDEIETPKPEPVDYEKVKQFVEEVKPESVDPDTVKSIIEDATKQAYEKAVAEAAKDFGVDMTEAAEKAVRDRLSESTAHVVGKLTEQLDEAVKGLRVPEDGKNVDPELVEQLVQRVAKEMIAKEFEETRFEVPAEVIQSEVQEAVTKTAEQWPKPQKGEDGVSVDMDRVEKTLEVLSLSAAKKAAIKPEEVDWNRVEKLIANQVDRIPTPKGVDNDMLRLMVEQSMANVTAEPGKAGDDGKNGRDALDINIEPSIHLGTSYPKGTYACHNGGLIKAIRDTEAVVDNDLGDAGWQVITDGIADIKLDQVNYQTCQITIIRTSNERERVNLEFPVPFPAGVYERGKEYKTGAQVYRGGSTFQAKRTTTEMPSHEKCAVPESENKTAWFIVAKRGRDGRSQALK